MKVLSIIKEVIPPIVWKSGKWLVGLSKCCRAVNGRERASEYYDGIYTVSEEYRKPYYESKYYFMWCVLVDRMRLNGSEVVLDVGCGPGQFACLLKERGVKDYVGLDFSAVTVSLALQACPEYKFVRADVFETDVFDRVPYDIVTCTEVLEHIEQDLDLVSRMRPGARVFGSVPSWSDPGHVRHFRTCAEVESRYGHMFTELKVDALVAGPCQQLLFVFDGVRK